MARKTKKKRVVKKKASARRVKKKTTTRATAKKPTKAPKRSASRASTSVDSLLKKFDKDRSQKESQLVVLQKKRAELEDRTQKLQEQIGKVSGQIRETESQIASLDSQRDQEVKELLARLGVKLGGSVVASAGMNQKPHADRGKFDRDTLSHANGRND